MTSKFLSARAFAFLSFIFALLLCPVLLGAQDTSCRVIVSYGRVEVKGVDRDTFIEAGGGGEVVGNEEVTVVTSVGIAYLKTGTHIQRLDPMETRRVVCKPSTSPVDSWSQRLSRLIDHIMVKGTVTSNPLGYKGQPEKPDSARLRILFPQRDSKLLETQPTFSWNQASAVFEVRLLLEESQEELWRRIIAGVSTLNYPSDKLALDPGKSYVWEVRNLEDPSSDDSATFNVAGQGVGHDMSEETQKIRLACRDHNLSEYSCSLAVAGFYKDAGYTYEAVQVLLKAQYQGTAGSLIAPLLHQLLESPAASTK